MSAQKFIESLECDLYSSKIKQAITEVYTAIDTEYTLTSPSYKRCNEVRETTRYTLLKTINQFQSPSLNNWNSDDVHSLEDTSDGSVYNTQMIQFLDYTIELCLLSHYYNDILYQEKQTYDACDASTEDGNAEKKMKKIAIDQIVEDFRLMSLELPRVLYRMLRLLLVPLQSIESVANLDLDLIQRGEYIGGGWNRAVVVSNQGSLLGLVVMVVVMVMMVMMSILTFYNLCFLLLSIHIFFTFLLLAPSFLISRPHSMVHHRYYGWA